MKEIGGIMLFAILFTSSITLMICLMAYMLRTIYGPYEYRHKLEQLYKAFKLSLIILLVYALGAFITLEWNPLMWNNGVRAGFSMCVLGCFLPSLLTK